MLLSLSIVFVSLFVLAYVSKRRYGLLGLALIAGSLISTSWAGVLTIFLQTLRVQLSPPTLNIIVAGSLIVLPALLLLLFGPKYHKKYQRVGGAILFSTLALMLFIVMIHREAPSLLGDNQILTVVVSMKPLLITAGALLAIADTIAAHWPKKGRKDLH